MFTIVEKIFTTSNLLLHIADFSVLHMQNKHLRLQNYCDTFVTSVRMLKTFATMIPSYKNRFWCESTVRPTFCCIHRNRLKV